MGQFALSLQAFKDKVDNRTDRVIRIIVLNVGTSLVLKSPVGDAKYWKNPKSAPKGYVGGRFRANWQYGLGELNTTTTEDIDPSGQSSIDRIAQMPSDSTAATGVHYITNSLPYAQRIEDGWSHRQAPQGVVKLTVLEFKPIVAAAAAQLK